MSICSNFTMKYYKIPFKVNKITYKLKTKATYKSETTNSAYLL